MKKLLLLSLLFLFVSFGVVDIGSAEDLEVHVACPNSVDAGSKLLVSVSTYNGGPYPVSFSRAMVGLTGNSGGTLGGLGIWGPFHKTLPVINIAPYSSGPSGSVEIVDAVPPDLAGKVAGVFLSVINSDGNKVIGSGGCMVNVK